MATILTKGRVESCVVSTFFQLNQIRVAKIRKPVNLHNFDLLLVKGFASNRQIIKLYVDNCPISCMELRILTKPLTGEVLVEKFK